jgi:hypothetical protein
MTAERDDLGMRLSTLPSAPTLDRICRGAVEFLGLLASAVVLMAENETGSIAASYGPDIEVVEDLQFAYGEGPCLTAFQTGTAVLEPDLATAAAAERWPIYVPAALAVGARAVFAVPLQLGAITLGVLYLARATPGELAGDELADAYGLAQLATVALLDRQQNGQALAQADGWSHRAVVHQATGMVAVQLGLQLADALARLRARAYVLDTSLYDIASDVVERRLRLTDEGIRGDT